MDIHDKILAIIAIVQTNITPTLNTTITFLTCLFPFTAVSIISENEAQKMATIINNTGINNKKSFSIFPSTISDLRANYSTQLLLHQPGFAETAKVIPWQHFSQKGLKFEV